MRRVVGWLLCTTALLTAAPLAWWSTAPHAHTWLLEHHRSITRNAAAGGTTVNLRPLIDATAGPWDAARMLPWFLPALACATLVLAAVAKLRGLVMPRDTVGDDTGHGPVDEPVEDEPVDQIARARAVIPPVTEKFTLHPGDPIEKIPVGRDEHGNIAHVPFIHTLGGGVTRAGKASLFWAQAWALRELNRAGLVEVYGVDPKYGLEFQRAADFFTGLICRRRGETVEEFATRVIEFFEQMHRDVSERAEQLVNAGLEKLEAPTVENPFRLIFVDELATVIGLCPDAQTKDRLRMLMSEMQLLAAGCGYKLDGAGQNMKIEMIGTVRDGFPFGVGFKLGDATQVRMLFDAGAVAKGVRCHELPYTGNPNRHAGHAYLVNMETGDNTKFRYSFITREDVQILARDFPSVRAQRGLPVDRWWDNQGTSTDPDMVDLDTWDTADTDQQEADSADTAEDMPLVLADIIASAPDWACGRSVTLAEIGDPGWLDRSPDELKRDLLAARVPVVKVRRPRSSSLHPDDPLLATGKPDVQGQGLRLHELAPPGNRAGTKVTPEHEVAS